MTTKILISLLSLLVLTQIARGQSLERDDDEQPPLSTERPGFTNGVETVGLGRIQFETGITLSDTGIKNYLIGDGSLLRLGRAKNAELRLSLPTYVLSKNAAGDTRDFSAASLGTKFRLGENVAVVASTTLPSTGSPALRQKTFQPFGSLEYSRDLAPTLTLQASVTAANFDSDDGRFNQFGTGLNLGHALNARTNVFIETYRFNKTSRFGGEEKWVDGGIQFQPSKNTQLDVNIGTRLVQNNSRKDYFVGAGFVVRI
jgi:hypothetical protein